ncbi:hypothetical protein KZC52_12495 [Microbacterium sp. kSW2-24]|uniref:hypothetical protein n=1 Tax=Microbacterium galbinum TaxID=2851646 RepID=UPI001FFCBC79|nr:hypothetical protein [Microbacterium galbinum]MCK2023749.1 hypothetical protein [Microbacterium galbinum]
MSIRRRTRVAAAIGIGVAATLALSGCTEQSPFEGKFVFPIVWSASNAPDMAPIQSARLTVHEDGTAMLEDFPSGAWDGESEPGCIDFEGESLTGWADWEFLSEGELQISSAEGSFSIYADSGLFGSIGWGDFFLYGCDGMQFGFSVRTQVILPGERDGDESG